MSTMAALVPQALPRPVREPLDRFAVEVTRGLSPVEAIWRDFEGVAAMSPYGRYDWIAAYAAEAGASGEVVVATVRERQGGDVAMLMPLAIRRRPGLRVACAIGGKHVNYNLPLVRPDLLARLSPEGVRSLLGEVGRALRVHAFVWPNMPAAWDGVANPFAAGGRPSPSGAWALPLEATGQATLARSMKGDARKKLRSKSTRLAQIAPVEVVEGRDPASVDRILDAFFRQKEERFGELGIADPFAHPGMRAFMHRAALPPAPGVAPAIELYGLAVGPDVVAVLGGAADRNRFAGMFLSVDRSGEASKLSPGEILITRVVELQCGRGRRMFDLGAGDARYKRGICDQSEDLVDVVVAVSPRGRLYAAARSRAVELKRRMKANPSAMTLVGRLRRMRSALRG